MEQTLVGLLIALPSVAVGYLAYRRSRKVDALTAQSGVMTEARAGTTQIIEGLNHLVDNLQEDNKGFREDIRWLTTRIDVCMADRDALKKEVARMRRRYGDNGDA